LRQISPRSASLFAITTGQPRVHTPQRRVREGSRVSCGSGYARSGARHTCRCRLACMAGDQLRLRARDSRKTSGSGRLACTVPGSLRRFGSPGQPRDGRLTPPKPASCCAIPIELRSSTNGRWRSRGSSSARPRREPARSRELGGFRERAVERAVRCNGERQAAALAVLADAARFGPDTRWPLRQGPGDDQRWFPVRHRHQLGHLSGRAASRARRDRDFPIVEQGVRRGGGSIRRITVSRGVADRPAPLAATAVRHPRTDRSAACLRMPFRDRARCSCYPSPRCRQRGRR